MINKVKKIIKRAVGLDRIEKNEIIEKMYQKDTLLYNFFTTIKQIGFSPNHIIDVGANRGGWTRKAIELFPNSYFTLIEPQKWLKEHISDILDNNPKVKFYPYGAGKENGVFKLSTHERDDSYSFRLTEDEAKNAGRKQIDVEVITINHLVEQEKLPLPDIIKIDAEGIDLDVLQGASNFFGKTEVFLVEAAVMNKSFKNNLFSVVEYMQKNNYVLFDITDLNRTQKYNALWLVELVFVKKDGLLDCEAQIYS